LLQSLLLKPGKIIIRETKTPDPSKGQLLIKVKAALTCGTDLKAFLRGHPVIPMPGPFGHEFSGVVAKAGKGVRRFKEGDEIMAVHSAPCLKCRYCKKKLYNLCENIMESKILGAFSEYILLPSHIVKQNVFHKPAKLSFEEAALLEPLSCVVHGIEPLDIKKGDTALVIGAGPIGLIHLMLLKEKGAVTAVSDISKGRLATAKKLGADTALKPEKIEKTVKDLTGGIGFDYIFECTGRPEVWESAVWYLRRGGTLVLFGGCPKGSKVTYDTYRLHYDEITLKGSFHFTPQDVKKAYELLRSRRLRTSGLISGSFPLKHIEKAFNRLTKGRGIKYAIIP
jgi:L-iditol 2-dehydrogenase